MKNFTIWALSQFDSLVNALAKNSRVQEDFKVDDASGNSCNAEFITDLLEDLETGANYAQMDNISLGNFCFIYDKKTRKTSIINIRSNKFVTTYCSLNDFMSAKVGFGVCWAKYNNVERPKFPVKKRLSELKPHDIFRLYTDRKYEFVGTTSDGKYIGYDSKDTGKKFYSFLEGDCTVWE